MWSKSSRIPSPEESLPGRPQPIAVADTLRYLMYFESYGKRERAQELYQSIPANQRFTQSDPASMQALAKASALCPQGIDIAERLMTAQALLESGNKLG